MSNSAVTYLFAAALFLVTSGPSSVLGQSSSVHGSEGEVASTQQWEREFTERVRVAPALGVAITFLKAGQRTFLLDLVRREPKTTATFGQDVVTAANVEEYAKRIERERQILSDVIDQRGFVNVAGAYDLQKDPKNECDMPKAAVGPITMVQEKFNVEWKDPAHMISGKGVIVESSIAIQSSRGGLGDIFLVGEVANGQVAIRLAGEGMECKIGILLKQRTTGG